MGQVNPHCDHLFLGYRGLTNAKVPILHETTFIKGIYLLTNFQI